MKKELLVLWTTDNVESAKHMVLLYTLNAKKKGWMDEVTLLIWGASQILVALNQEIQDLVKEVEDAGVKVVACKKCAEEQGNELKLSSCGINVFYTGELLSNWLLEKNPLLSV
jgi:hypothetical protein